MASENRHNGGGTGPFNFTFPSIKQSDIKVSVNNTDLSSGFTINNYNSVSGGNVTFSSNTASGTNNVRIYRETEPETLAATFVSGSSIRAIDLNTCNKQSLFVADENTTKLNNLALGNSGSAIVISGTNIADNSITTQKILDLEVKSDDISSSSSNDSLRAITTNHIRDNAVTTSKIPDNNVTANKLKSSTSTDSDRAVTTNHIRDGAVTQVKLDSALLAALQTTFSNPIGTVIWFAGTTAPTGYLKCNGDAIPNGSGTVQGVTADFSALYAIVSANVPDLRGEFIRGWDDGKGIDSGRGMRTFQSDQWKNHQHVFGGDDMIASSNIGNFQSIGSSGNFQYDATSNPSGNGRSMYTKNSPIDSGGTETRPRNVSLLACIKY